MEKTEIMKRYEEETDKQSAILKFMSGGQALEQKSYPRLGPYDYNMDYIAWLESKAEAYDRLMSGEVKTLKDMANIFQMYSAIDKDGYARLFADPPFIDRDGWSSRFPEDEWSIPGIVDFNGHWKDSLTLPDGWEVK